MPRSPPADRRRALAWLLPIHLRLLTADILIHLDILIHFHKCLPVKPLIWASVRSRCASLLIMIVPP